MTLEASELTFEKRDDYLRRPIAEKVVRLLQSDARVSPMAIDGGWGTGKTEFCHKLINLINAGDSGYRAIYVDAFKADHADEPLLALLAEVLCLESNEEKRDDVIRKILPAVRFGLKTGLKAAVSHVLRQDAADIADGFESEVKAVANKSIDAAVETLLKDHVKANENLETLKGTLSELAKGAPIVIFVDELDRCRPDFAVAVLETIKHVFDVEDVKFVLVTNTDQLRASINHRYGSSVDAQRYLDKFLGFTFSLSTLFSPDGHHPLMASVVHCRQLIEKSLLLSDTKLGQEAEFSLVATLIELNSLSLREVETFINNLEIYQSLTEEAGLRHNVIFGFLLLRIFAIFVFSFDPVRSKQLTQQSFVDAPALARLLGQSRLSDWSEELSHPTIAEVLVAIIGFESSINEEDFKPRNKQSISAWERLIERYFDGRISPSGRGGRVQIITKAINVMTLSG